MNPDSHSTQDPRPPDRPVEEGRIHQVYATHCTYGTSAIERRQGDLAGHVMGYSARAGSLPQEELRGVYRMIERLLYYYLPGDFPASEKPFLSPRAAPQRLLYCPALGPHGDLQIMGQICYRQMDVVGRPGSYFGHFLIARRNGDSEVWSPLDCLRLWGAPGWVYRDDPEQVHDLPPLEQLDEMRRDEDGVLRPPAIDDLALHRFLTAQAADEFLPSDADLLPPRWMNLPREKRRRTFRVLLAAYMEQERLQRDSLLVVAEPAVAALLFFGMARLLPDGPLRRKMSFSTYESHPERLATNIAATVFHEPDAGDVRPEQYQRRFVLNTFLDKQSPLAGGDERYVDLVLRRFIDEGPAGLDALLADFTVPGGKQDVEQLTALSNLAQTAADILNPRNTVPEQAWRQSGFALSYLRRAVRRRLPEVSKDELYELGESPSHLRAILALAGDRGKDDYEPLLYLVERVPGECLSELARLPGLPEKVKLRALYVHARRHGGLPKDCDFLWTQTAGGGEPVASYSPSLAAMLLARLPPETVEAMWRDLAGRPNELKAAFIACLMEAVETKRGGNKMSVMELALQETPDAALPLLKAHKQRIAATVKGSVLLRLRLEQMLDSLLDDPGAFEAKLQRLLALESLLQKPDKDRLSAATELRRRAQESRPSLAAPLRRRPDPYQLAQDLSAAAAEMLKGDQRRQDAAGCGELAQAIYGMAHALGVAGLLPPDFVGRLKEFLHDGNRRWWQAPTQLPKPKKPLLRRYPWAPWAIAVATATLVLGVVWRALDSPSQDDAPEFVGAGKTEEEKSAKSPRSGKTQEKMVRPQPVQKQHSKSNHSAGKPSIKQAAPSEAGYFAAWPPRKRLDWGASGKNGIRIVDLKSIRDARLVGVAGTPARWEVIVPQKNGKNELLIVSKSENANNKHPWRARFSIDRGWLTCRIESDEIDAPAATENLRFAVVQLQGDDQKPLFVALQRPIYDKPRLFNWNTSQSITNDQSLPTTDTIYGTSTAVSLNDALPRYVPVDELLSTSLLLTKVDFAGGSSTRSQSMCCDLRQFPPSSLQVREDVADVRWTLARESGDEFVIKLGYAAKTMNILDRMRRRVAQLRDDRAGLIRRLKESSQDFWKSTGIKNKRALQELRTSGRNVRIAFELCRLVTTKDGRKVRVLVYSSSGGNG